ncbi:MAG: protein TolQ [Desulfatiglans sp.]|jgi:biopolymer transport protein TolQ|nr:protein TolQ [Desulfatiglans sp.]
MEVALGHDIIQMIIHAGMMVKFVLLVLFLFSVISWTIIFVKFRMLGKAREETEVFLELFWDTKDLKEGYLACQDLRYSPVAYVFRSGYSEFTRIQKIRAGLGKRQDDSAGDDSAISQHSIMENVRRSLKKTTIDQINRLERAVGFLATTGNTAPFIGLFGTVWGIMEAFRGIGLKGSASLAVVAPGISEALVATAAGLAAAIPAVVAYNYFTQKISALQAEMDIFASEFLSMVERQFVKRQMIGKTRM